MKLLLDNNLSYKLVAQLQDTYQESSHVALVGMSTDTDSAVWEFARDEGYCLVSKDSDFNDLLAAKGFPPKVIWLRIGNCTTLEVATLLQENRDVIVAFGDNESLGLLELHKV